ncbi:MAG: sigma-54 dependent transcriptional regulator [Candidatus Margulisbacteria bacterium]|nr:sigma-54 dependent transcriptional regulator [Candidatus Margulisiibacteriota bacterium]
MEKALIKKEKDFFNLWMEELSLRNSSLLNNEFFARNSKNLAKSIFESSQHLKDSLTTEEFISIAQVLQVIVTLQKNNFSNKDIIAYLESLLSATQKAFSKKKHDEIIKFQKLLNQLLVFINNQQEQQLLLKEEINYLETKAAENILSMVGSFVTINKLINEMKPVLDNDVSVLIEGETGTGKELMARAIYANGKYKDGPFIALNCAAIPEDLMESEMFGYKKGAFTDASGDKPGKIELANNGVLFLDEVYELSSKLQAKLLRVLQDKTVVRIGESRERKIQLKLICTSNKNLKNLVEQDKFREDLFYRINVYTITLPPLRERQEDIVPLAEYFLKLRGREFNKKVTAFSRAAFNLMHKYRWPGNVRELDNVVTRAILKANSEIIDVQDLDIYLTVPEQSSGGTGLSLKNMEKIQIEFVLGKNKGNIVKTAKELGITRATLYNKLKEYGL